MAFILAIKCVQMSRIRFWDRGQKFMSIRLIAKDLYRLIGEVEELKQTIADTPFEDQADLKEKLRKLQAERNRMREVLEGCKDRN